MKNKNTGLITIQKNPTEMSLFVINLIECVTICTQKVYRVQKKF